MSLLFYRQKSRQENVLRDSLNLSYFLPPVAFRTPAAGLNDYFMFFNFLKLYFCFFLFPLGGASAAYGPDGAGMGYMMDGSQQMHIRPPGQKKSILTALDITSHTVFDNV